MNSVRSDIGDTSKAKQGQRPAKCLSSFYDMKGIYKFVNFSSRKKEAFCIR